LIDVIRTFSDTAEREGQRVGLASTGTSEAEAQHQGPVPKHDRKEVAVSEIQANVEVKGLNDLGSNPTHNSCVDEVESK